MDLSHENLAILQAQVAVQNLMLQALMHSHPEPETVLQHWRRLRADRVAAAYTLPADVRNSDWLSEHIQTFADDWTAELVEAVTRQGERATTPAADRDAATS